MFDTKQDTFDSREVIERLEDLEAIEVIDREPEEQDELDMLYAFQNEVDCSEWTWGMTFINDDYLIDYFQEFLTDIGDLPSNIPSYIAIDWEATKDNLIVDYTSFELDGTTFWTRL